MTKGGRKHTRCRSVARTLIRTMQPPPKYLKLFRMVVMDVWAGKQKEVEALLRGAEKRLSELKQKQEKLVEAFVYQRAITKVVYEEEVARLEDAITTAQIEANEAKIDHLDWNQSLGSLSTS